MIGTEQKQRLLEALKSGMNLTQASELIGITRPTARNWLYRWRRQGKLGPSPLCRCGKPLAHKAACRKVRLKPPAVAAKPLKPVPIIFRTLESEWHQLVLGIRPVLLGYTIKSLRDRAQAEDLVSQTVLKLLESPHLFSAGSNFRAWAFTIHCNFLNSHFRTKGRRPQASLESTELSDPGALATPARAESFILANEIILAIARDFPESRDVCFAIWLDGLSYQAAAEKYRISEGMVKSRLWRVRVKLGRMLEPRGAEG